MVIKETWRESDGRQNVRHSSAMPVNLAGSEPEQPLDLCLRDIGQGGVGLRSPVALQPGETFHLTFPLLQYPDDIVGRVVWCQPESDGYTAGLQFVEAHPYSHARLVVDVCHIEFYLRDQRQRLGRDLDHATATQEWQARQTTTL